MFDAIQDAHLSQHRNIGDLDVLLDIAVALGHDRAAFAERMRGRQARQRVQADRDAAMRLGIRSIPTLIVGADLARLQTTPLAALRQRLQRWPRPRPEPDPPASEPPGSFLFNRCPRTDHHLHRYIMNARFTRNLLGLALGAALSLNAHAHGAPSRAPAPGQEVGISPWGPDDEIGRLNLITPESRAAVMSRVTGGKVYDLATEYYMGMPSWQDAGDPRYQFWMTHTPRGTEVDDPMGVGRT